MSAAVSLLTRTWSWQFAYSQLRLRETPSSGPGICWLPMQGMSPPGRTGTWCDLYPLTLHATVTRMQGPRARVHWMPERVEWSSKACIAATLPGHWTLKLSDQVCYYYLLLPITRML